MDFESAEECIARQGRIDAAKRLLALDAVSRRVNEDIIQGRFRGRSRRQVTDEALLSSASVLALGMPEHCIKFTLFASTDDAIVAEATYYPEVDSEVLITEKFRLVRIEGDA